MILLLCIWPLPTFFFFFADSIFVFYDDGGGGGVEYSSVSRPFVPFPFFWEAEM